MRDFLRDLSLSRSLLATLLRMFVMAVAAVVLVWPLAEDSGRWAACVGAASGVLLGRFLAETSFRLLPLASVFALGAWVLWLGTSWIGTTIALELQASPSGLLAAQDAMYFGFAALAGTAVLRLFAARVRFLAIAEVSVIGLAFTALVAPHRGGAIHRPFEIADPILAQGGDPTKLFLAIGAGCVLIILLGLLEEQRLLRTLAHLGWIALFAIGVYGASEWIGPPGPPDSDDSLGLRGKNEDGGSKRKKGGQSGAKQGQSSPEEELDFKNDYSKSGKRIPVAIVILRDDYSPPGGVYYFRQSAFSQFNGSRLVRSTRNDSDQDLAAGFAASSSVIKEPPPERAERTEVETTVALLAEHARPFALESPVAIDSVTNPAVGRFKRTYNARSRALSADVFDLLAARAGKADWKRETREHYTSAPTDKRYRELADTIVEELLSPHLRDVPLAKALAVTSWLGREGKYSTRSKHADATDPTAHFLFGDRTGYCVHFSHAAAFLMRSLGIPSRVATGYAIEESARQGGSSILLSGQDSHAWAEIYLEGQGWVPMDVVPQTILDRPPPPPDPDLQRLLGDMLRNTPQKRVATPTEGLGHVSAFITTLRRLALPVLSWSLALCLLVLYATKLWRRMSPHFASPVRAHIDFYRAELDRLSDLHIHRHIGESREAFAKRVAATCPSLLALTQLNLAATFGNLSPIPKSTLAETARLMRNELRENIPWWRRALGSINPWSWIQTR